MRIVSVFRRTSTFVLCTASSTQCVIPKTLGITRRSLQDVEEKTIGRTYVKSLARLYA